MSTRLIEECFGLESQEEKEWNEYISLGIPSTTSMFIVDPYMIDINDLRNAKPGKVILVRARRPAWGRGL